MLQLDQSGSGGGGGGAWLGDGGMARLGCRVQASVSGKVVWGSALVQGCRQHSQRILQAGFETPRLRLWTRGLAHPLDHTVMPARAGYIFTRLRHVAAWACCPWRGAQAAPRAGVSWAAT